MQCCFVEFLGVGDARKTLDMGGYRRIFGALILFALFLSLIVIAWHTPRTNGNHEKQSRPSTSTTISRKTCCDILLKGGTTGFYADNPVEQKQLNIFFRTISTNATTAKLSLSKAYTHTTQIACCTNKPQSGIIIWIEEKHLGNLTSGGSNFRVLFGSTTQQICSYDDYLNGTYVVFCPALTRGCTNVSIDILYVNFDAFKGDRVPLNTPLWSKTLCPVEHGRCSLGHPGHASVIERTSLPDVPGLRRRVAAQNRFVWSQVDGSLRLTTYNSDIANEKRRVFQPTNKSELCR